MKIKHLQHQHREMINPKYDEYGELLDCDYIWVQDAPTEEYIEYTKKELVENYAQAGLKKEFFHYWYLPEGGNRLDIGKTPKIGFDLLEYAFNQVLAKKEAERAAFLVKALLLDEAKPSWQFEKHSDFVNMRFEFALMDEELDNLLLDTPLTLDWVTSHDIVILKINGYDFVHLNYFKELYEATPKPVFPNLHEINKDTFAQ